jgi:IPT/TIG domain
LASPSITSDFTTWSSSNSGIAQVTTARAQGVALGTATAFASGGVDGPGECACNIDVRQVTAPLTVPDPTPVITGIHPSDWNAGATTQVTFSGQYFGTNAPTLSFSPSSGISYTLSSHNDIQIVALVRVAAGTPNENVGVSVTNNGYGGSGFNGGSVGNSATSAPVDATVHAPINSPEVTVIAWVNPKAPDLVTLPSGANQSLVTNLNNPNPNVCGAEIFAWSVLRSPKDVLTSTDQAYANAWLVKFSANLAPPPTITPSAQLSAGNFRLFNDFGGSGGGGVQAGVTPDPCGTKVPAFILNWIGTGQASQYMGASNTSPSGKVYQLAEGRIGTMGQIGSATINGGRTVPWIWSVIEFDSSGNPTTSDHAVFPTYSVYVNGNLTATYPQSSVASFIVKDQTYQRTPSQIQ